MVMPEPAKTVWQHGRRVARGGRVLLLSALFLALGGLVYLNQVGLPEFVKTRVVSELRARGLDLYFSRLRLHWYRGIVAEQINLRSAQQPGGPQLFIDEIEVRLNHAALWHGQLRVDSLKIARGRLVWPLPDEPSPAQSPVPSVKLDQITTELRFLPNDQWELDKFEARCLGAKFRLSGTLTNASWSRQWRWGGTTNLEARVRQRQVRQFLSVVEKMHFSAPPEFRLRVWGDARDWATFSSDFEFQAAEFTSPWAAAHRFQLNARLAAPKDSNGWAQVQTQIQAIDGLTPWGQFARCQIEGSVAQALTNTARFSLAGRMDLQQPGGARGKAETLSLAGAANTLAEPDRMDMTLQLAVTNLQTDWGQAASLQTVFEGQHSMLAITNWLRRAKDNPGSNAVFPGAEWIPQQANAQIKAAKVVTRWGSVAETTLQVKRLPPLPSEPSEPGADWGWWSRLAPFPLSWELQCQNFQSPKLRVGAVRFGGRWQAPEVVVETLHGELYGGSVDLSAHLDVASRAMVAACRFDFDAHQIAPLLDASGQKWLRQYDWEKPPAVSGQASVVLPVWTDARPKWEEEVLPTLCLDGFFRAGNGGFLGVPITSVQSHFTLTNGVWQLPDLVATRPEGRVELSYIGWDATQDYYWGVDSRIDLKALKPLLTDEQQQRVFANFEFSEPPWIKGGVWGRWQEEERIGFKASVVVTNFVLRSQPFTGFTGQIDYTNRFLLATHVEVYHGTQSIHAPYVAFDAERQLILITNALCRIDPFVVTRPIGPKTTAAIQPYQFGQPPTVWVNGVIPMQDADHPNLEFRLSGGPFTYWKFNVPQISALVQWHGDSLVLTNVAAEFYQGRLTGDAGFDFTPAASADFHFDANVRDAELRRLMQDLSSATNRLEGALSGRLVVSHANSTNWQSWNGYGHAHLTNGLIWDIPLFGMFSPVLNRVWPGLGNNRADEGTATFGITNGLIHTGDLEIRTPSVRLHYEGNLDFNGQVNARTEATLLRDTWLVGRFFNFAFSPLTKLFEYRITGTVREPKSEPLYFVPKLLLKPLRPFKTLRELFPTEPAPPGNP